MSCRRYRDQLRDKALGAGVPAEVTAHLESCPRCRAMLAADEALARSLDERIGMALTTEEPPDLAARVRQRVAQATAEHTSAPPWTSALTASMRVPLLGALVFLVAWTTVVVLVVRRPATRPAGVASPTTPGPIQQRSPVSPESRSVSLEYRDLEGFRPVHTMTIEVLSRERRP